MKLSKEQTEAARKDLKRLLQGQHEIKTLGEYRGMTGFIRLFIVKNNELVEFTHLAADALGENSVHRDSQPYGLKRSGYGYSKEFDVVYSIGSVLYPKGYKHTVRNCHSNDHSNGKANTWHNEGGYRFRQRSI